MSRPKHSKTQQNPYNPKAAGQYWSHRLRSVDPLAAVLTYNAHPALNEAYDKWERLSLTHLLPTSLENKKALDIGCGIGRITVLLAKAGAEVTALDISNEMLHTCQALARKKRVVSRVRFVRGSAHDFSLGSEKFDVITCFGLLEHLPPQQRSACFKRAVGVLKSQGKMYVILNNRKNIFLRDSYHLSHQKKNGYYVSLVGMKWLDKICNRFGLYYNVRAANPFYAIVHYYLNAYIFNNSFNEKELRGYCNKAVKLDLTRYENDPFVELLASHFLVEIRHKR